MNEAQRERAEIREAMDKTSGVTPVMAGVLKDRLGNLTSAVALRLTFMGMLSKNERKRHTYSEGVKKICRMVLSILDTANIYKTTEAERDVDVIFPSPLPENLMALICNFWLPEYDVPVLLIVNAWLRLVPAAIVPKSLAAGEAALTDRFG